MTVGIDFCLANTYKEAAIAHTYVKFDEKIHLYLLRKEQDAVRKLALLTGLDPYGDKLFSQQEILELVTICDILLSEYRKGDILDQKIRKFAKELKLLCEDALSQGKKIFAAGD
ncbi:hypothetical protein [Bacillus salipaludis]|uniref:hypothetical protein n=1 Tax=Bacillus salipaludis TaxID=2547811 RepID=UPI002E1A2D38|nr:hypothetical protein [Bacillus salipaludis]